MRPAEHLFPAKMKEPYILRHMTSLSVKISAAVFTNVAKNLALIKKYKIYGEFNFAFDYWGKIY